MLNHPSHRKDKTLDREGEGRERESSVCIIKVEQDRTEPDSLYKSNQPTNQNKVTNSKEQTYLVKTKVISQPPYPPNPKKVVPKTAHHHSIITHLSINTEKYCQTSV